MSDIDTAIKQLQAYMAQHPGIMAAPVDPPDQISQWPTAVAYPQSGVNVPGDRGAGSRRGLHTIILDVHWPYVDLAKTMARARPYLDSVPNMLFGKIPNDNKWKGAVDAIGNIDYQCLKIDYGGTPTLAIRFTIRDVKILGTIS